MMMRDEESKKGKDRDRYSVIGEMIEREIEEKVEIEISMKEKVDIKMKAAKGDDRMYCRIGNLSPYDSISEMRERRLRRGTPSFQVSDVRIRAV